MDEVEYFADMQWHHDVEQLTKELLALNEGRNLDCWPLGSFGGRDADLDPCGCTGIEEIVSMDEERIVLKIGGHKTFVPSEAVDSDVEEDEEWFDEEQWLMFDIPYPGDWTGDDWCIYTEEIIEVPWVMDEELGEPDYKETAKSIIRRAQIALEYYEKNMQEYSEMFDKIHPEEE